MEGLLFEKLNMAVIYLSSSLSKNFLVLANRGKNCPKLDVIKQSAIYVDLDNQSLFNYAIMTVLM